MQVYFAKRLRHVFILLPFQGVLFVQLYPGRCPGLYACWPFRPFFDYYSCLRNADKNNHSGRSSDYYSRLRNVDNGLSGRSSDYYSRLRNVDKRIFQAFLQINTLIFIVKTFGLSDRSSDYTNFKL